MKWFCWTTGYERTPREIEAETAEAAAEEYASWYDQDRCERKFAREGSSMNVHVVAHEPVTVKVRCHVTYTYEVQR